MTSVATPVDPVTVGLVVGRLTAMLEEQQSALVSTAFSSVVRESLDLACALFDSTGEMVGQSRDGTPGHINSMATGMRHIVRRFPEQDIAPGDVLITNDPWKTAGQINDLTVATPVFRGRTLLAWFASCCHSPDIGGRILSAAAAEVYEEGLRLPILKLRIGGRPNAVLEEIIRANVRTPDETLGDIYAQVAANEVGARSLLRLMDELRVTDFDAVAAEIMDRSERAVRQAILAVPDGRYCASMRSDGFDDEPIDLHVAVTVDRDHVEIDYAGSSAQSEHGVNVVLNYTRAYTSYAIKAALAPEVPHNAGSFRPVRVTAPAGSIVNCLDPAPVASRHLVGHFLPGLIFDALRDVLAGGLPAASSDALWMLVWRGRAADDTDSFTLTMFGAGGTGARPTSDGLNTTGFPTGVRAAPTEVLETLTPLVQRRRELRPDSGGAGTHRGGLGQVMRITRRGRGPWSLNANIDRVDFPAPGTGGGRAGAPGIIVDDARDAPLARKRLVRLPADADVRLEFPGGGGQGDPVSRPIALVLADVVNGYVSERAAREDYGVSIEYVGPPDALVRMPSMFRVTDICPGREPG